jgi:hypothetical protein
VNLSGFDIKLEQGKKFMGGNFSYFNPEICKKKKKQLKNPISESHLPTTLLENRGCHKANRISWVNLYLNQHQEYKGLH